MSSDTLPPPAPPVAHQESKGRNCWVVGCGGCLIGLLVLVAIGWGVGFYLQRQVMVEPFAPVVMSEAEAEQTEAKLQALHLLDESGQVPEEFTFPTEGILLSEDEVNYWLSLQDPELGQSVRLDFEPGEVSAELRLGKPGEEKRLKLSGRLSVEQTEGGLDVRILEMKLGPFAIPDAFMEEMSKENIAAEALEDPEVQKKFEESVERIEILKDRILFVPKAQ